MCACVFVTTGSSQKVQNDRVQPRYVLVTRVRVCDPCACWPQRLLDLDRSPCVIPEPIEAVDLGAVVVRPVAVGERGVWQELMERFHYLGGRRPVGESLCYVASIHGQWLALLAWASAAFKSRLREAYVGWDEDTKLRRLHLVANNVRFLILPWVRVKHLASRVLGLNLRRLSRDWERVHGHGVLLAETFVDLSRFSGTCYRAANWEYLGQTRGSSKRGRHYYDHGRPKGLFVYRVHRRACEWLCAPFPCALERRESRSRAMINVNALPLEGQGGLLDVLDQIPDPRKRRGKRHPLRSVLAVSVCAVLSGMRGFTAIAQWAQRLPRATLRRLRCGGGKAPSEPTIRRVLQSVDVEQVDRRVGEWLLDQEGFEAIAIDGKTLKGSRDGDEKACHLLSAVVHEQGTVVAQQRVDNKTNETKVVKALLDELDLEGVVVTADALHTQCEEAEYLVRDKKADYLFTVKGNQPTLEAQIAGLDWDSFFPSGVHKGPGARPSGDPTAVGESGA